MATAVNMRYLVSGGYLVCIIIQMIGIGLVYNLDKKTFAQIQSDLKARRAEK